MASIIEKDSIVKKLLLCLSGFFGLCLLFHGCHNIAKPMDQGAIMYSRKCSSCHNLIEPNRFDKEQWQFYVDKYGKKMTIEEKQLLLDYLANSR
jgi:hypothetical protein